MIAEFFYSLMTDKRKGAIYSPLKGILYLLSLLYGLTIAIRAFLYRWGAIKAKAGGMKIISVGNLTLGGTGKTPFVLMLTDILKNEMRMEPCILMRGYGWDEQALLKKNLPDVPVLIGEDRVKQAHRAVKLYGSKIGILDDGFQYWELKRDLDIVLINARSPFGNGRLFPRGTLRENQAALSRAEIVVYTKVDRAEAGLERLKEDVGLAKGTRIILEAVHAPKDLYDVRARKVLEVSFLRGKRAILFSSIGDPSYFEETVRDLGAECVAHFSYRDHHDYSPRDIEAIEKRCDERRFDLIVTTEKDSVKLARLGLHIGAYPLMVLCIEMRLTRGKEDLIARLHSLVSCTGR